MKWVFTKKPVAPTFDSIANDLRAHEELRTQQQLSADGIALIEEKISSLKKFHIEDIQRKNGVIEDLKRDLDRRDVELEDRYNRLEKQEFKNAELQTKLSRLEAKIVDMKEIHAKELKEKDAIIADLKDRIISDLDYRLTRRRSGNSKGSK